MENYYASLVLRKDHQRKDGTKNIYLYVNINNKQKKYTLGPRVKENHWNAAKRKVTSGDAQYVKKNLELESKLNKANDILFDHKVKNIPLDIAAFDKIFQGTDKVVNQKTKNSFFAFCYAEIDYDYYDLDGSYDTHRTRKSTIRSIEKFAKKDIAFKSVDYNFIKNLLGHLVKLGKSESTKTRTQKLIRTMFNRAIKQGIVTENPMDAFKIKERAGEREFLHPDELKKLVDLYNHPDTEVSCKKALRVFLFCCNTGLRYRDVKNLRFKNIISTVEKGAEKHKLRFIMHKTKDWHEIPLNETALRLLPDKTFDEDSVFCSRRLTVGIPAVVFPKTFLFTHPLKFFHHSLGPMPR